MHMYGYEITCDSELKHYGLKGMHWGIRRWQNEDGTFNAAGKERYFGSGSGENYKKIGSRKNQDSNRPSYQKLQSAKENYKKAASDYRKSQDGEDPGKKYKNFKAASNELTWAKTDYKNDKILEKLANRSRVSTHEKKLIEYYKNKGMNDEEAAIAAYKRARTEKILIGVGAVAVTAVAAYGATKYVENNFDKVIKANTPLARVATSDTKSVQDAFYAVFSGNKNDTRKYTGIYARQIQEGVYGHQIGTQVFKKTIRATENLKMASPKSAMNALQDLMNKDSKYREELVQLMQDRALNTIDPKARARFQKALHGAAEGKVNKELYESLNQALGSAAKRSDVAKKYYTELTARGYNAIVDVNDKKFSGFMTKTPMIVFNAQSKVSVDKVTKIPHGQAVRDDILARRDIGRKITMQMLAKEGALYAVAGGSAVGISAVGRSKNEQKIVAEYRREHPNSNLSYTEIIRNYERERG